MSLWMSPITIILFFSCSFISREVNSADRRLWSGVFIHLFSILLSRLMKWLTDSNNMLGVKKKKQPKTWRWDMWGQIFLSGHPRLAIPTYVVWLSLLNVKNGSAVKTAETSRAKESHGHLMSAGWFSYAWKKRIGGENVRLCNCL